MLTYGLITLNSVFQDLFKKSVRESEKETISSGSVHNDVPKKGFLELFYFSFYSTTEILLLPT